MDKNLLKDYYFKRGYSNEEINIAVRVVKNLEIYLKKIGKSLQDANVFDIKKYVQDLIKERENDEESLLAIARYFYLINSKDIYIYFTSIFGSKGVMDNIKSRASQMGGEDITNKIFDQLPIPSLGTSGTELYYYTNKIMNRMEKSLNPELYRKILAGNNHNIPKENFLKEKDFYEKAENLDTYLKDKHQRKVAELQKYCDDSKIWFEQKITQEVVDYVNSNQEILSAVRKEDELYITKIPYDLLNFLNTDELRMKYYYTCHCPFIRESFLSKQEQINANWCYCSAGFVKFPFEVIFDTELEVELLESPLMGDELCRFRIHLPKKFNIL